MDCARHLGMDCMLNTEAADANARARRDPRHPTMQCYVVFIAAQIVSRCSCTISLN